MTRRAALALAAVAMTAVAAPAARAQEKVIKIGAPLALTGALADEGKKQAIGYELWLARVKAAGGIKAGGETYRVEMVTYDYQTDAKRVQQLAEKLIADDKVDFLLAPYGSGHTKIVAAVAERYGIPMIASVASSEAVYDQSFKNLFGTLAPNAGLTDAMLQQFRIKMPSAKKVAVLGRDDVFPKSMADALAEGAPKQGYEVVYKETYAIGTMDHATALSRIKGLKPDWIYVTGYTQDLVLIKKQMADLGLNAPIVTMVTGPAYQEFIDNLGPLADNVSSVTWWHHSTPYKSDDVFGSTQAFYEDFKKREKADPDYVHASSAAALVALQKAIEKAGSKDRDKVRAALATLDIQTFYGPIKFGPNGMNSARNLPIIQVQDGKIKVLFPEEIRQADLRLNKAS
jgi:branched-chain amino acid transport system substrate-binding protein